MKHNLLYAMVYSGDDEMQVAQKILPEPELKYELPRVYKQPKIKKFKKDRLKDIEDKVKQVRKYANSRNGKKFSHIYNQLITEYQPLINWAFNCWDYLLTKKGCRFISRLPQDMPFYRGDYRVFKKDDFKSLVYKIFKLSCLEHYPLDGINFTLWMKKNFWKKISESYEKLKYPSDNKQRILTSYSYLRCIPYRFLNNYHQKRVDRILDNLNKRERKIIELYYFKFYKDKVIEKENNISNSIKFRKKILSKISKLDYLVYALLVQIERY